MTKTSAPAKAHRPQAYTVFGAAIVAGAAAAFGLNSALDSHLAQAKPQVESESILVALRPLPAGSPVTVWDVGLRDWPKAMVPSTAMRVTDELDNLVVRHPLREGQPILAIQLGRVDSGGEAIARPLAVAAPPAPSVRESERDLWATHSTAPAPPLTSVAVPPLTTVTTVSTTFATATAAIPVPAAKTLTTGNPGLVAADQHAPAAPETAPPTLFTGTPTLAPPATPTASISAPSPDLDPLALPAVDAATTIIATATPALEAPAPIEIRSPRAEQRGDTPPAPLRTALRPRPSVVQALSVPDRSALRDEGAGHVEERPAADSLSGRVASAAAAFGEGTVAAPAPADATPSMLPAGGDANGSATSTQASRAPAPEARSRATPPAPRPTRAQAFTKGYRPN
ncbi:MAG: SAF domain-containing protein [Planctomycetota bacterium]|nr:SAF domain-containing protein [Planctomycetota bacterium]